MFIDILTLFVVAIIILGVVGCIVSALFGPWIK